MVPKRLGSFCHLQRKGDVTRMSKRHLLVFKVYFLYIFVDCIILLDLPQFDQFPACGGNDGEG